MLMTAVDFAFGPSHEVVIAGDSSENDTGKMLEAVNRILNAAKAHSIAVGVPPDRPDEVSELIKLGCQFFESCSAQGVLAEGLRNIVRQSREEPE